MNNHTKQSTFLGSLISISLIAIILIQFFQSPLLTKTNPSIIDQTQSQQFSPLITLNQENFPLYFTLTDSLNRPIPIDPTVFKIDVNHGKIETNETNGEMYFLWDDAKKVVQCPLTNFLCVENNSFFLEGDHDEPSLSAFSISLSICNNETDKVICKPFQEIKEFFKSSYMGLTVYFTQYTYDVLNYTNPLQPSKKNFHFPVTVDQNKNKGIYLKKLEFSSDDGFYLTNEIEQNAFMVDQTIDNLGTTNLETQNTWTNYIISFIFFSSKNIQKVSRRYQKIQELLGSLNGTMTFLIMVGYIITSLQIDLNFIKIIINELYTLPLKADSNERKSILKNFTTKKSRIVKGISFVLPKELLKNGFPSRLKKPQNTDEQPFDLNSDMRKKSADNQLKREKPKENKNISININLFQYLKMKLGIFSKSSQLDYFNTAEERFYRELDVITILKKLQEFEKLKMIILDEKQLTLFNFLAKPLIGSKNRIRNSLSQAGSEIYENMCKKEKFSQEELRKTLNKYEEIGEKNLTEVDRKLFRLLDIENKKKI